MSTLSPAPPRLQGPSFLSLPAELRLWIYEAALTPTLELAADPWAQFPPWSRFSALPALALTSRQVGAEATSLFYKSFAPRARLYFDDGVKLHDFCTWAMRKGERVRRLKVILRMNHHGGFLEPENPNWAAAYDFDHDPYSGEWPSTAIELLHQQPRPGADGTRPAPEYDRVPWSAFNVPVPWMRENGEWVNELWPGCGLEKRYHRSSLLRGGIGRHNTMTWPQLREGLGLSTHVCVDSGCDTWAPGMTAAHIPVAEMEGELHAITFAEFQVPAKRANMYHHTRRVFDPSTLWEDHTSESQEEWGDDRQCSEADSWNCSSSDASENENSDDDLDAPRRESGRKRK